MNKSKLVRKASPPRQETENTFMKKLEELRQQRQNGGSKKRKLIVNGKEALDHQGDWALFESSKGRKYYFNIKTQSNQWVKPQEWIEKSKNNVISDTIPPQPNQPFPPPPPPNHEHSNGSSSTTSGFKMKIQNNNKRKNNSKTNSNKNNTNNSSGESKNLDENVTIPQEEKDNRLPKAYMEEFDDDEEPLKLPKIDAEDRLIAEQDLNLEHSSSSGETKPEQPSTTLPSSLPPAINPQVQAAILAAKAKIESQIPTTDLIGITSSNAHLNNATWLSEYNFPAVLSRCKFPKTGDALHELSTNRTKKRTEPNLPPLPPEILTGSVFDFRRDMFYTEVKNSNNRHRLLSDQMNSMVYKIPDELWERSFPLFNVELLGPNIKLECRPHAFTEENVPVYTRTGKVAKTVPFPEDIVRCHAVLQAWHTEICHCVYANKTYTIERDDRQWKKDLEEAKKFLMENGY